tara:strand:+ start:76 stop:411 length:336 start_codon:yes stop_codon:yes gene_type:complete
MQRALLLTAKTWSAFSLAFMGLALIGQLFAPEPATFKSTFEVILFSFFPIGVSIGLIISWWKSHLIGGAITTSCLVIFHIMRPDLGFNTWVEGLSAPGILFLIYGIFYKAK